MDEYLRTRQANIGTTSVSWSYDGNNLLSQVAATGVQRYDYSFDVNTGNLISRTNYLKAKTDSFGYSSDNLDKLISVKGPVNLSLTYTADKNGNILTKGDAGTYVYDATQPYAVDQLTGGQNISATQQDISYYSFEKVKNITEGTKSAEFVYNPEQQRIRMILKTNGTATKTRWYFGGSCERELAGGVTTQYIWIGGDAYSAKAVAKKVGTGAWTVYNIFRDHLGTITHLKDVSTGTVTEYSFDAWGRRRDKDDWTMTLTGEPALFADRGFTAHEYLEDFKLYNMNGRLYDPVVGRFLNADPVIQDAGFTQNYNRYSYCLNNPLKYSDPSGMIHSHYWLKNQEDGITGGTSDGGGGGLFSGPGGENGTGEGGVYYDYSTGKYRTTDQGNPIVGFDYALSVTRITMPKDIIRDIIGLTSRGYYKWQRTYAGGILNRNEIEDFDNVGAYRFFPFPNGTFRAYNPVNPSTIGNNIFGLSYAGGDNPKDYHYDDSYEYVPTRKSDYPPIGHDRRYSNLGIKGFKGLAFDTRAIGADWRFVTEEYMIALNPLNNTMDRIEALGLGLGLGFIATPKTLYQLCQPNGMQEINRYYNISNIGVTNEPGTNNY